MKKQIKCGVQGKRDLTLFIEEEKNNVLSDEELDRIMGIEGGQTLSPSSILPVIRLKTPKDLESPQNNTSINLIGEFDKLAINSYRKNMR